MFAQHPGNQAKREGWTEREKQKESGSERNRGEKKRKSLCSKVSPEMFGLFGAFVVA